MKEFLTKMFVSSDEPRLRAGWRLVVQFIILIGVGSLIGNAFNLVAPIFEGIPINVSSLTTDLAIILSIYIARRFIDQRSFSSLGLQKLPSAYKDTLVGIAIAGAMMGFIYLLEYSLGWLSPAPSALVVEPLQKVLFELSNWALIFIAVGFGEEIFSRGYQLQNLEDGLNTFWAVFLSSGFFGLLHILNPGASWISTIGILLAGIFLAYGYLSTRQLWLPIGLHIGWNFFEGPIFGFSVSGFDTYNLLRHNITGPELITGGAFGPEAGLVLLPGLALGFYLIYLYTKDRKKK